MIGRDATPTGAPGPAHFLDSEVRQKDLVVVHRAVGVRELVSGLSPGIARQIQKRLEPILIDDPEFLLSLRIHLDQVRGEPG